VPEAPGLRPTGDRIRETLFNWLAGELLEARCLDLYAGSGALGIEALSRGAAGCDFVDNNPRTAQHLREQLEALGAGTRARVQYCDDSAFLAAPGEAYDIVFLDPPFADERLSACCRQLADSGLLAPAARIYLERERSQSVDIPDSWSCRRDKCSGGLRYALYDAAG